MINRRPSILVAALVAALAFTACSGSDDSTSDDAASADTVADGGDSSGGDATADDELDLPNFESDFDRICETGVGFADAAPLTDGPGPHPMVLFQETDSGVLITSSLELPAGWIVEQDSNFDDNSDLAVTELVGCSKITAKTPNGVSCDLEGDDGDVTTLALVDVSYELTVHEATTGALLGTEVIEAVDTECPFFAFVDEDQTDFFNTPDADQYTNAVKAYITP